MTQGVGRVRCSECRRVFGGTWGFRLHRVFGRCLNAAELRARGMRRRPEGVWVRSYQPNRQRRLFRLDPWPASRIAGFVESDEEGGSDA